MKKISSFLILGIVSLACIGCLSAERPMSRQYVLNTSQPDRVHNKSAMKVLEINNVAIVPQFTTVNFVYRVSDINYLVDYYNVFFTPPEQQINEIMITYLRSKNIFSYVANDAGQLKIDYILYPKVTALYADYRNSNQPRAVIAIDCTLFSTQKENKPLMHKLFTAEIPLAAKDSDSLVRAWNQGLQQVLAKLSVDLNTIANQK